MLKYFCTNSKLANWVIHQVGDQPGVIFPTRKGWQANIKLHYPTDHSMVFFLVAVSNGNELLLFIPLNEKVDRCQLKSILNKKLISTLKKDLNEQGQKSQTIFMTCEKHQEQVTAVLNELNPRYNLLMLNYERMFFVQGNFKNPRLEYRLGAQDFDTDLIPNFLPEDQQLINDGITNALFYQNFLFNLNQYWLSGSKSVNLRTVLKDSIPYWKQYRKKDQKIIIEQIREDLSAVNEQFFENGFQIDNSNTKNQSCYEPVVYFPTLPVNRKEFNVWAKKQDLALDYLRDEGKQISIDGLDLPQIVDLT